MSTAPLPPECAQQTNNCELLSTVCEASASDVIRDVQWFLDHLMRPHDAPSVVLLLQASLCALRRQAEELQKAVGWVNDLQAEMDIAMENAGRDNDDLVAENKRLHGQVATLQAQLADARREHEDWRTDHERMDALRQHPDWVLDVGGAGSPEDPDVWSVWSESPETGTPYQVGSWSTDPGDAIRSALDWTKPEGGAP